MATDVEKLVVSLEASITKFERTMGRANQQADKSARQIENRFKKLNTNLAGSFNGFGTVATRAFAMIGASMGASSIIEMTSAWSDLTSRIANAAGGMERGSMVMDKLSVMARRTYSSLEQTAEGFLQNEQALSALGYSTQEQLDLVETLNNALVVGAVRGDRARSVQDAWSKAMASGSLRGENLNTIIQSGGRLSKALAESMGVSVNQLRKLGEEGKITTDAMYGVTSQLGTLRIEAGNMPATVSDGFVLLRDAVWKFVGEADAAAGSSAALAEAIIAIADAIDRMPQEGWFDQFFRGEADKLAEGWEATRREIEAIGRAIEWLQTVKTDDFFRSLFDPSAPVAFQSAAEQALSQVEDSWRRVATEAYNAASGQLQTEIANVITGINDETLAADEAAKKLAELAVAHPDAEPFISIMAAWTDSLYAVRDGALAAAAGMSSIGSMPSWRQFEAGMADLGGGLGNTPPARLTAAKGGGGKSPTERYAESLADFERRLEMLREETALMSTLNPLVNDYGYAKVRLKAVQELENAAKRTGIELDTAQKSRIEELASAYATASAEAARLAETQSATVKQFAEMRDAARSALETIIDGFVEGKDAGDIFADVLKNIGSQLLQMGMNSLFGGGATPGSGLFGSLFGGFREKGGPVQAGRAYVVGEKRPEVFVPSQNGTILPRVPQGGGAGAPSITFAPVIDARGADIAAVAKIEQVVQRQQSEFESRVKQIVRGRGTKWR